MVLLFLHAPYRSSEVNLALEELLIADFAAGEIIRVLVSRRPLPVHYGVEPVIAMIIVAASSAAVEGPLWSFGLLQVVVRDVALARRTHGILATTSRTQVVQLWWWTLHAGLSRGDTFRQLSSFLSDSLHMLLLRRRN
jgi:hypothetical protein